MKKGCSTTTLTVLLYCDIREVHVLVVQLRILGAVLGVAEAAETKLGHVHLPMKSVCVCVGGGSR